ncbi:3-hydroxybutyryl-CoA dehydrogenase [Tanacetum coccineum]
MTFHVSSKKKDIVIQAIVENEDVKKKLCVELDKIVKGSATCNSSYSSCNCNLFIGMHFHEPTSIMNCSDIRGLARLSFAQRIIRGSLWKGILMPIINEAFHALYIVVATKEDIDAKMKSGTDQSMGPSQLADFIGLDMSINSEGTTSRPGKYLVCTMSFACALCRCWSIW